MGISEATTLLICAIGALAMVPGALLLYSRPGTRASATALSAIAIVAALWVAVGDALVSGRPSGVVALLANPGAGGVAADPVPTLLQLALALSAVTLLAVGTRWTGRRGLVAVVAWLLIVLLPVARWMLDVEWGAQGLEGGGLLVAGLDRLLGLPALDFAGGIVLHVTAGASVLASALIGRRSGEVPALRVPSTGARRLAGGLLFWAGSVALGVGMEGALDDVVPSILASGVFVPVASATAWVVVEHVRDGRATRGGVVSGLVTGIAIAAAGSAYLEVAWAVAAGILGGAIAAAASRPLRRTGLGGPHDLVAIHLLGGGVGALSLGVGAIGSGVVYTGMVGQFVVQLVAVVAVGGVAFGVTALLTRLARRTPTVASSAAAQRPNLASPHE